MAIEKNKLYGTVRYGIRSSTFFWLLNINYEHLSIISSLLLKTSREADSGRSGRSRTLVAIELYGMVPFSVCTVWSAISLRELCSKLRPVCCSPGVWRRVCFNSPASLQFLWSCLPFMKNVTTDLTIKDCLCVENKADPITLLRFIYRSRFRTQSVSSTLESVINGIFKGFR